VFEFFSSPQNVLHLSSKVLGLGVVLLCSGVIGAYGYEGQLGIVTLVSMLFLMRYTGILFGPRL